MRKVTRQEKHTIEVSCPSCEKRFRLRPAEGQALPDELPCPRCHATIEVPASGKRGGDRGWVKTEISTIFEHPDAPRRRPEDRPRPQPDQEQPKRVFRDVTSVGRPTLAVGPDEPEDEERATPVEPIYPVESTEPAEKPSGDSLLQRLKRLEPGRLRAPEPEPEEAEAHEEALESALDDELLTIADEAASAVTETVAEPEPEAGHREPEPEPEPGAGRREPEQSQTVEWTDADRQGPWPVRVDDVVYAPVDEDALATLLKTGVWLAVIELRTGSGHWIPLEQHPAYPTVRERLLRQTQQIVRKVTTGEWDREPETPSPAPQPPSQAPRRPALSIPDWLLRPVSFLAGLALGAVALSALAVWMDKPTEEPAQATEADVQLTAPVLRIPPTSEPSDADWKKAIGKARGLLTEAHRADTFAEALIANDKPAMARETVLAAMIDHGVTPYYKEVFNQAIAADPALHPETTHIGMDVEIDAIYALGGGRSISLRMTQGGKNAFAFKPAQEEWGNGWRSEVAADTFCKIVPCHFEVPNNRAARISRPRFEALYGKVNGDWQTAYSERFANLHWVEEQGPDGKIREYLYGTLKDWVPHFVDWPIEYTEVWEEWLDVRFHPANLDEPYKEALEPFKRLGDGKFHEQLIAEQGEARLRDVARQLSSILVFDYLTQNWDRFSSAEKYYGVNNQFAAGRFISLDNGAAFYDEPAPEVGPRFEKTTRFSRSMIAAVRALDPEKLNDVLFPKGDWIDRRRMKLFWEQRDKLLERVDALVAEYGAERVYEFE